MEHVGAKLDFALSIEDAPDRLAVAIEYSSDLFDIETIERISFHFLTLLEAVSTTPNAGIMDLPILPQEERKLILETWNSNRTENPPRSMYAATGRRTGCSDTGCSGI